MGDWLRIIDGEVHLLTAGRWLGRPLRTHPHAEVPLQIDQRRAAGVRCGGLWLALGMRGEG